MHENVIEIEIEEIEDGHVVLAIPSLRPIVMGSTLEEARAWARSAIAYRGLATNQCAELCSATDVGASLPSSNAA